MIPHTVYGPSIASIAAGLHDDGETITVTGIVNCPTFRTTRDDRKWATYKLIGDRVAIDLIVFPDVFDELKTTLGPVREPDGALTPPTVTVIGDVNCRDARAALIVKQVTRSDGGTSPEFGETCPTAKDRAWPQTDEGVPVAEVIAKLRSEDGAR